MNISVLNNSQSVFASAHARHMCGKYQLTFKQRLLIRLMGVTHKGWTHADPSSFDRLADAFEQIHQELKDAYTGIELADKLGLLDRAYDLESRRVARDILPYPKLYHRESEIAIYFFAGIRL